MFLFLIFLFLKFILNFNLTIRRYKEELKKKDLATQIYSETLELFSPTEPNRIELNMASRDPKFFNISMFFRVRLDRTVLTSNIEILKKFRLREPMFNSIRFGSVGEKSSRVSL